MTHEQIANWIKRLSQVAVYFAVCTVAWVGLRGWYALFFTTQSEKELAGFEGICMLAVAVSIIPCIQTAIVLISNYVETNAT